MTRVFMIFLLVASSCSKAASSQQGLTRPDIESARRILTDRRQPWWSNHAMPLTEPLKIKMAEAGDWANMNYNPPGVPILPIVLARVLLAQALPLKDSPFEGRPLLIVDVRPASDFYVERIPGSRNLPVRDLPKFPDDLDRASIVAVTGETYPHHEVIKRVREAGFAAVYCLEGGMQSWRNNSYPLEGQNDLKEYRRLLELERQPGTPGVSTEFLGLGPLALKGLIDSGADLKILFVGDEETYAAGHIPGAFRGELGGLEAVMKDIPKDQLIAVYCGCCAGRAGGYSEAAARQLRRMGYTRVLHLDGHLGAWREAGYPVVGGSAK